MRNQSSVAIILLNWNGWKDTLRCLSSVGKLDYRNKRVIVVDNGSTDDSVARIRAAYPEVLLLETGENLGFSGGCNVGMRHALGSGADYVWLLNNDTEADRNALSAMVALAESDAGLGAIGSLLYYMDSPETLQAWGGGWISFMTGRARHHRGPVATSKLHYLTAASLLIRRSALEAVGLLDEENFFMYWEDTDFCLRLRAGGWKLAVSTESIILHRESASTGKGSPLMNYYFNESAVRFMRRHAPIPAWPLAVGIIGRLTKRALEWNWPGLKSTFSGCCQGFKKPPKRKRLPGFWQG